MSNKVFTLYQTNRKNILGGYMTYPTLDAAMRALCPANGVNTITLVTYVDSSWWHGKKMPYLCEPLYSSVIFRA